MERQRKLSIILLSITAAIGLVRGFRMSTGNEAFLFPYPKDTLRVTVFSNYAILGWIVFSMIGLFSVLVIAAMLKRLRNYAYLIIVEGIFVSFLTAIHILITGFVLVHLFIITVCIGILILGIKQVPREF